MRARLPADTKAGSTNRTVRRGLSLLREFRPGFAEMTNSALADSTGLPRSTVSRITGALVDSGLLRQLPGSAGYAPTAACISLGFAALQSLSEPRRRVLARMQEFSETEKVSVSLAFPDGDEMTYIDTFRKARRETTQYVAPGARLPMEFTALGLSSLAVMEPQERSQRIDQILHKHAGRSNGLRARMAAGIQHHVEHGWCRASWLTDIVGVARAVHLHGYPIFAFNCAGSTAQMGESKIHKRLVPFLFELTEMVRDAPVGADVPAL